MESCQECLKLQKALECVHQDENHWYREYLKIKDNGDSHLRTEYEQELEQKKKESDNLKMIVISQAEDLRRLKLEKSNPQGKLIEIPKRSVDDYYGEYARPMKFVEPELFMKGDGIPLDQLIPLNKLESVSEFKESKLSSSLDKKDIDHHSE